ncbi:hypothetical protein QQ045_021766 [Rhodiola kirilowii]
MHKLICFFVFVFVCVPNEECHSFKVAGYGTPSTCALPWGLDFDDATTSKVISRFEIVCDSSSILYFCTREDSVTEGQFCTFVQRLIVRLKFSSALPSVASSATVVQLCTSKTGRQCN